MTALVCFARSGRDEMERPVQLGPVHAQALGRLLPLCGARPVGVVWQSDIGPVSCERCLAVLEAGLPIKSALVAVRECNDLVLPGVHVSEPDRYLPLCGARVKGARWKLSAGRPDCDRCCDLAGIPHLKQEELFG